MSCGVARVQCVMIRIRARLCAEDVRPLAVLGAIHLKHITDLAWSPDGRYLVASSHDGYCTVVSFEPGELGEPLKNHRHDAMSIRTEMAQRRPPVVRPVLCVALVM